MVYPDEILALMDNVQSAFSKARTIEQEEAAWDHFHVLEGCIERTWPHERATIDTLRRLKSGLSTFTIHVRQGLPSLYNGGAIDRKPAFALLQPELVAEAVRLDLAIHDTEPLVPESAAFRIRKKIDKAQPSVAFVIKVSCVSGTIDAM